MLLLFLVIAALVIAVLVVVATNPVVSHDYARRWTGIGRSRSMNDQSNYPAITRLFAILAIVIFVFFVLGVINFESVFKTQGAASRQLIRQEIERDRELRETLRNRPGLVPPPLEPERPRP